MEEKYELEDKCPVCGQDGKYRGRSFLRCVSTDPIIWHTYCLNCGAVYLSKDQINRCKKMIDDALEENT